MTTAIVSMKRGKCELCAKASSCCSGFIASGYTPLASIGSQCRYAPANREMLPGLTEAAISDVQASCGQ